MILLDTHVLVWLVAGSERLGRRAHLEIQGAWDAGEAAASAFALWEVGLLYARKRLDLAIPPRALHRNLQADGLDVVPVDDDTALRAAELAAEGFFADPADCIIAATAMLGGYTLATADRRITAWARRSGLLAVLDPAA